MKLEERWKSDEGQDWANILEPIETVRSWDQAKSHLISIGVPEEEIEILIRTDFPERQVADHIAGKKGYIYPNYRPL